MPISSYFSVHRLYSQGTLNQTERSFVLEQECSEKFFLEIFRKKFPGRQM